MKKWILTLVVLVTACAYPMNFIVDTADSVSEEDYKNWRYAADRIEQASGLTLNLAKGKCEHRSPGCIDMVEDYKDPHGRSTRTMGKGSTYIITGWASAEFNLGAQAEKVMLHELLHAMGVPHVSSRTVMYPTTAGAECISDAELQLLCAIRACRWRKPECKAKPGWKIILESGDPKK